MTRLDFLTMREQVMENIESIIDSNFGEVECKDEIIVQLCDMICETMDPIGLN